MYAEVTDGWYAMRAALDAGLSSLARRKALFEGQKLRVCGAALRGCSDGVAPLECRVNAAGASSEPVLALHMNGTRRARWAFAWLCLTCRIHSHVHTARASGGMPSWASSAMRASVSACSRCVPLVA